MVTFGKSSRWILVGIAVIVLVAAGATGWIWYSNYRAWHNSKAAPLFPEIDPADGATVYESDLWIRWSSPAAAKGRVLWRKVGSARVQSADAGNGQELLAHLASVSAGSKYEYIVEVTDGSQTMRSSVRTLNVQSGLSFDPVLDQTVEHDYDQSVKLTLRNRGSQPVVVAAKALKQFEDLPSDITGYGSVDVPGQIGPNGTLDLRLAVTAADATRDTYETPIEAGGAYVTARFHVRIPKLNLAFNVLSEDPKTLAKTVEIRNNGDVVTDLSVHAVPENQADLEIQPAVNHARVYTGGTMNITVTPILYLEFQSIKAEIEATAAGQSAKSALEFTAPPGMRLIAFRSASGGGSDCRGGYCSNHPDTCSECAGPPGNGPAAGASVPPAQGPLAAGLTGRPPDGVAEQVHSSSNAIQSTTKHSEQITVSPRQLRPFAQLHEFFVPARLTAVGNGNFKSTRYVNELSRAARWFWTPVISSTPAAEQVHFPDEPSRSCASCEAKLQELVKPLEDAENQLSAAIDNERQADRCYEAYSHGQDQRPDLCNPKFVRPNGYAYRDEISGYESDEREASNKLEQARSEIRALLKDCCSECEVVGALVGGKKVDFCESPLNPSPGTCRLHGRDECEQSAKVLRDEYRAVGRALQNLVGTVPGVDLTSVELRRQELLSREQEIESAWDKLRAVCLKLGIDIGSLRGGEPPVRTIPSLSDPSGNKPDFRRLAGLMRSFATEAKIAAVASVTTHAVVGFATEGASEAAIGGVVSAAVEAPEAREEAKSWQELADRWQELANEDPPSSSYMRIEEPVLRATSVPVSGDPLEQAVWAASQGRQQAGAYLKAFLTSYERYQGALSAKNKDAMLLQAQAMIRFADRGLELSRVAALKDYQRDRLLMTRLDQAQQILSKNSLSWSSIIELYGKRVRGTGANSPKVGTPTPQQLAQLPLRLQAHIQSVEAVRDNLPRSGGDPIWPEPPDRLGFEMLKETARILANSAATNTYDRPSSPVVKLRLGLLEALQRRAGFTRLHRGPFASQSVGDAADSSGPAVSFHTGEHVYFAWHQRNGQVVFTGFDPAGRVVSKPQVIGTGHWPRIAADEQRVAIAWNSTDANNFIVRLNDGKQWGGEIQLTGREAVLSFASGGALYAATSNGVWKLNGDHFDRFQEANYSQPAIAIDKDGKPHVASNQNGHILYDGSDIGEGERPSVVIAPDGTVNLAYISKGALVVRSGKGGQWTQPDTIPAKNPSWPTLALDSNGGVRLSYIGAADYGPDALWLVRLADKQPILMPSLGGNVTDAWFTTEFDLHDVRSNYRPHDLLLTVNDVWVKMFQNTVPEGRYLFRLNPYQVFTSSGQPVPNRVAIHSWHMNPGHYNSSSQYRLGVRLAWSEHYVFAANEDEARRSITSERVNHDQPDLGIFANAMNLAVEQPKPGRIDIPVMIANLGEATSSPVRVLMIGEQEVKTGKQEKVLTAAQVPALKPGADTTITMPFDYDGKLPELTFRLENNHDFDPSNDSLTLRLWGPKPTGYEGPEPGLPKVPLELTVKLFNESTPPSSYRILHAFSERMISKVVNGEQFGPLPSGPYRIAVQQYPYEGQEVLFTDKIEHQAGVAQIVQLDSGIKIDQSELVGPIWQWAAVEAGNPDKVIQWQDIQHPLMALPPGHYQFVAQPDEYASQRLVWPQKIQVRPDELFTLKLTSGIRLEVPKEMGAPDLWQVVKFGKPDEVLQWHRGSRRLATPLPPGEYQFVAQPDEYASQRLVWPQKIQVRPDELFTLKLTSGIRLEVPKEMGAPDLWQVVKFGKPDEVLQWHRGNRRLVTPLPPGEYQFVAQPDEYASQRLLWPQKIVVQPDQLFTLNLGGGIRLEVPKEVGAPDLWQVVKFGKPDEVLQWHRGDRRLVTPLPAGIYSLRIRRQSGEWRTVAEQVEVREGQVTDVRISELPHQ